MMIFNKALRVLRGLVILGLVSGLWAQPTPFVICDELGDQREPVVIYDDQNGVFIVAWADWRSSHSGIFAARVDTLGNVLDPDGQVLYAPYGRDRILPQMDMGDTSFLMVCAGSYTTDERYYMGLYHKDMSFIRGYIFSVNVAPRPQSPWVCYTPDTIWWPPDSVAFRVFYPEYIDFEGTENICFVYIPPDGLIYHEYYSTNTFHHGAAAVWNGNKCFVVWEGVWEGFPGPQLAMHGWMNPSPSGPDTPFVVRDASDYITSVFSLYWDHRSPKDKDLRLAQNGYLLASETGGGWRIPPGPYGSPTSRIWIDFLDTSGLPTRPLPFFFGDTLTRDSRWPTVAYNHPSYMVAWQDSTPDSVQIRAVFFDTLQNYDGPEVLIRGYRETQPDLIASPSSKGKFFLVWAHWNGPPTYYDIYGMFLDSLRETTVGLRTEDFSVSHPIAELRPNPFTGKTTLEIASTSGSTVSIYDPTGRLIKSFTPEKGKSAFEIVLENPGVYLVLVKTEGRFVSLKAINQRR